MKPRSYICTHIYLDEGTQNQTFCGQFDTVTYWSTCTILSLQGGIATASTTPLQRLFSISADNFAIGSGGQRTCQPGYMLDPETSRSCVDIGMYACVCFTYALLCVYCTYVFSCWYWYVFHNLSVWALLLLVCLHSMWWNFFVSTNSNQYICFSVMWLLKLQNHVPQDSFPHVQT